MVKDEFPFHLLLDPLHCSILDVQPDLKKKLSWDFIY